MNLRFSDWFKLEHESYTATAKLQDAIRKLNLGFYPWAEKCWVRDAYERGIELRCPQFKELFKSAWNEYIDGVLPALKYDNARVRYITL